MKKLKKDRWLRAPLKGSKPRCISYAEFQQKTKLPMIKFGKVAWLYRRYGTANAIRFETITDQISAKGYLWTKSAIETAYVIRKRIGGFKRLACRC